MALSAEASNAAATSSERPKADVCNEAATTSRKAKVFVAVSIVVVVVVLTLAKSAISSDAKDAGNSSDLRLRGFGSFSNAVSDAFVELDTRRLVISQGIDQVMLDKTGHGLPFYTNGTSSDTVEQFAHVQSRVRNVRLVFCALAWVFLCTPMKKIICPESAWVLPHYEAIHIQLYLLMIALAAAVTAQLWTHIGSTESRTLNFLKLVLQGLVLVWGTYALPRATVAVYDALEAMDEDESVSDSDDGTQTVTVNRLVPLRNPHSGPPNRYLLILACCILFLVRPLMQVTRDVLFSNMGMDVHVLSTRDVEFFYGLVDFVITTSGVLTLGMPGLRYFHELRDMSSSQRWIWGMLQALVVVITFEGLTVTWMASHQLAIDLKALMVLFEIAACVGMINFIADKADDIAWIFKTTGKVMEVEDLSVYEKVCCVCNLCSPFMESEASITRVHAAKMIYTMARATKDQAVHCAKTEEHAQNICGHKRPMPPGQHRFLMPYESLHDGEEKTQRNFWVCVTADIFSNHVRSHLIAAGIFATFILNAAEASQEVLAFLHLDGDNKYKKLAGDMVKGLVCYVLTAIMLHGNNVFVGKPVYHLYCFAWASLLLYLTLFQLYRFMSRDPDTVEGAGGTDLENWLAFSIAFLSMNTLIVVVIRFVLSENAAEFLRGQVQEQMYAALKLENLYSTSWPKVGDKVRVKRLEATARATVKKNRGDGFYDIELDQHPGMKTEHLTVLRKRMHVDSDTDPSLPMTKHRRYVAEFTKTYLVRYRPPSHLPVIVLVAIAVSACAIFAIAAVMANAGTLVLNFCFSAQEVSTIVYSFIYEEQPAGCTEAGGRLFEMFDTNMNHGITHRELPLFAMLHQVPPSVLKYMIPYEDFVAIWPAHLDLDSAGLSKVMCVIRTKMHDKYLQAKGVATIIQQSYHTNLTGDVLADKLGAPASKVETKSLLVDAVSSFIPASLAAVVDNGMTFLWDMGDDNANGLIEQPEWDVIALGMNFMVGRLPQMIGIFPCAEEGPAAPPPPEDMRRLTSALESIAGVIKMTNFNFNNELDKHEWMFLVNIISSLSSHSYGKKYLTDLFNYVSGGAPSISWIKIERLATELDKFLTHADALPHIIGGGNFTAREMMQFLVTSSRNSLTRDEARPFEAVLASNSNAVRADQCLEAGFTAADVDHNGVLQGQELDDPGFGYAVKDSFGDMSINFMKASVASIPKACRQKSSPDRMLGSVESVPFDENSQGVSWTSLAKSLHHAIGYVTKAKELNRRTEKPDRFAPTYAALRMLSPARRELSASAPNSSQPNVVEETVNSISDKANNAAKGVKGAFGRISDWLKAATSTSTLGTAAAWWLQAFSGTRSNFALHCLAGVCYGSNILATLFSALIVYKSTQKYKTLFRSFQTGRTDYQGFEMANKKDSDLTNCHATVTLLPAQLAFSIMFGWLIMFLLAFILLSVISLLLIYWDWTVEHLFPYVVYYAVYLGSFFFLKNIVIEQYLVAAGTGEIIYPRLFSCLWIVFIVYNWAFGISLAIYRILYMIIYTLISTCFVHYSIFPNDQLSYDPGYYGLLTAAYTSYERSNPLKRAFISVLAPETHRRYGPLPDDDDVIEKPDRAQRMKQARNRFNLALTLWRNPTIQVLRCATPEAKKPEEGGCCSCLDGSASDDSEGQPLVT